MFVYCSFRAHQSGRVDSRTLFADHSSIPSITKDQDVIPAPPELSSITEQSPDSNTQPSNQSDRFVLYIWVWYELYIVLVFLLTKSVGVTCLVS